MENSDFSFRLVYGGDDLDAGTIDVRDLAPALIAFADLMDYSGRLITPEMPRLTVRVQTGFKKGSFDIGLELANAYDKFVTLFSGNHIQAWAALCTILGISGTGLWQLLKRAKGKKPRVIQIERSEKVRIQIEGNEPEDIPKELWTLFNHAPTRRAIEQVVEPITREGIDSLEIRKNDHEMIKVRKDEALFFKAPVDADDEQIFINPNAMLTLLSPSFRQGNKWRVHDGSKSFWVNVEDKMFIQKVDSGMEAFRKGDILYVVLQTRQWIEGNELKAEYAILEVHRHENKLRHPKLPGTENAH